MIKEWRVVLLANILVIITISILGNLLILMAVPYCLKHYRSKFSTFKCPGTFLFLHLAACDSLYAALCLSFQAKVFIDGYLKWDFDSYYVESIIFCSAPQYLCSWSAYLRHLIAYASFLTIAAIALIRCIVMLSNQERWVLPSIKGTINCHYEKSGNFQARQNQKNFPTKIFPRNNDDMCLILDHQCSCLPPNYARNSRSIS